MVFMKYDKGGFINFDNLFLLIFSGWEICFCVLFPIYISYKLSVNQKKKMEVEVGGTSKCKILWYTILKCYPFTLI